MADKAFTQEEVNTIVQDRLAKEKAKFEKQLSDAQADIRRREKRLEAREQLQAKGLPVELADLVKLDDDESFNTSLSLLESTYNSRVPGQQRLGDSPTEIKGGGYVPAAGGQPNPENDIRKAMGLKF